MVRFDGTILKIARRQNLNRCLTHAVLKHLRLLLVLLLLLLLMLLLEGASCISHRTEAAWGKAAAVLIIARKLLLLLRENSYVFGKVIVPRGIILLTLQIINRTIRSN